MGIKPKIQRDFISLFGHYFFHALNTAAFLDVQTSVAVISPSKAKSVCSLSVWFVKQTETVPSGKQENEKTQLVNLRKCISHQQRFLRNHKNGTNGNELAVFR